MIQQSEKFKQAFESHKKGDLELAKDLYLELLQNEKDNAEAWDLLGVVHYQTKDYLEAELCIKKAIENKKKLFYN